MTRGHRTRPFAAALRDRAPILTILICVTGLFAIADPRFIAPGNLANILLQSSPVIIVAVGMTFVVLLADIDLSVGAMMYLSAVVAIMALTGGDLNGRPSAWAIPLAVVIGAILGAANGLLTTRLRVVALVVTLGTMSVYKGIGQHLTGARPLSSTGGLSDFVSATWLGVRVPVAIALICVAASWFVLAKTSFGRELLAVGGSVRSARETGIRVRTIRVLAFTITGVLAATAGILIAGQVGQVQNNLGDDYPFTVITAVVIGGTSLFGGRGSVIGTTLGAILLIMIENGLNLLNASPYFYDAVRGLILVAAVLVDVLGRRTRKQRGGPARLRAAV